MSRRRRPIVLLTIACVGFGCASLTDLERQRAKKPDRSQMLAQPAPSAPQDPLETIARFESMRTDGDGILELFLARGEEATRARAAEALGRLAYPEWGSEVTLALVLALDDPSPRVRAKAAFAIGMRADPGAAPALAAHLDDGDASVRAEIISAASRLPEQRLWREVLHALNDPAIEVRKAAALAPHRWPSDAPDAAVIESTLIEFLAPSEPENADGTSAASIDHEIAWRLLFSLQQRKSERARVVFERGLMSEDARARIFSAQGLGKIASASSSSLALCSALANADWRVVCEAAVALGKAADADARACLVKGIEHPSPHVRRCVIEALANARDDREMLKPIVARALADSSANVRASACVTDARLFGDAALEDLETQRRAAHPVVLAGVAQALGSLTSPVALPPLLELSRSSNLRVAGAAIEALGQHDNADARARLRELLLASDNGLRLAAVEALRKKPSRDDLPLLKQAFETARGDGATEVAFNVLENAAAIGGDEALALLKQGLAHSSSFVSKKAREWIDKGFPAEKQPKNEAPRVAQAGNGSAGRTESASAQAAQVAFPGASSDESGDSASTLAPTSTPRNPRVTIRTSRGPMTFELFPEEAPMHVENFLALAKTDHYDKLTFHRVVPDFVIQGGDYRGDGNGAVTFDGEPLRAEFTPRAYVRGSLGMPRNEDPDSGGSQFFVTHRETPHLDGRYTIFGELREGFDVLDSIEVGDTILDVEIAAAGGS